jgi:hypothetical protein
MHLLKDREIIVKSRIGMTVAAAALLSVGALKAIAGESQFQAPATDRARETRPLLTRAALALNAGGVPLRAGERVSNLWLFPTADEDTVFAQYTVSGAQTLPKIAASQGHLELIKLSGDRIVEQRDLTHAANDGAAYVKQPGGRLDETALIGTGHAMGTPETSITTHGSPASPHWTASIGNGHTSSDSHASADAVQHSEVSAKEGTSQAPSAHWTSKIGTGHAVDSSASPRYEAGRVTASVAPSELNAY